MLLHIELPGVYRILDLIIILFIVNIYPLSPSKLFMMSSTHNTVIKSRYRYLNVIVNVWCQDGNTSSRGMTEVQHLDLNQSSDG